MALKFFQQDGPVNVMQGALSVLAMRDELEGRRERRAAQKEARARQETVSNLTSVVLGSQDEEQRAAHMMALKQFDPEAGMRLEGALAENLKKQHEAVYAKNKDVRAGLKLDSDMMVNESRVARDAAHIEKMDVEKDESRARAAQARSLSVESRARAQGLRDEQGRKQRREAQDKIVALERIARGATRENWAQLRQQAIELGVTDEASTPAEFATPEAFDRFKSELGAIANGFVADPKGTGEFLNLVQAAVSKGQMTEEESGDFIKARLNKLLEDKKSTLAGRAGSRFKAKLLDEATEATIAFGDIAELGWRLDPKHPEYKKNKLALGHFAGAEAAVGLLLESTIGLPDGDLKNHALTRESMDRIVQTIQDSYRVMVTGAAAPQQELNRIAERLNTNKGYDVFVTALREIEASMKRAHSIRMRVLMESDDGITQKEYWQKFDELWKEIEQSEGPLVISESGKPPADFPTQPNTQKAEVDMRAEGVRFARQFKAENPGADKAAVNAAVERHLRGL